MKILKLLIKTSFFNKISDFLCFNDRYQEEGHLGSLRSPLRADTERMGRYHGRGLRHAEHRGSLPSGRRWRGASQLQPGRVMENSSHTWQLDRY